MNRKRRTLTFRPWVLWAGLLWGLAEATLFFIVPDVLLTLVALFSFRRSARVLACILLGALAGGTIMFYLGAKNPAQAKAAVLRVPFVSATMFDKTQQSFQHDGIWALTKGPGNGIPYKVYCVQASRYSGLVLFLAGQPASAPGTFCPVLADCRGHGLCLSQEHPATAQDHRRRARMHLDSWATPGIGPESDLASVSKRYASGDHGRRAVVASQEKSGEQSRKLAFFVSRR